GDRRRSVHQQERERRARGRRASKPSAHGSTQPAAVGRARDVGLPKLQSLLPTKLRGVAARTATAWAGIFGTPTTATSNSSTMRLKPSATRLTMRKRAAWKPARACVALKVQ